MSCRTASASLPCIVCTSPTVVPFAEIPSLPTNTNRIWFSREEARAAPRAQINLAYCDTCGHVFNHTYDDDLVDYEVDYENAQIFSPRFRRYVEKLADSLIEKHDLHHKRILEIGGGRGEFLSVICHRGNNHGVSIGPSYRPERSEDIPPNIRFITDYYTAKYRDEPADMIICRQVLEHFWAARDLIVTVRAAISNHLDAIVYFEVPNGNFILNKRVFWEFHYQHVSYFTKTSLAKLFTGCGFEADEIRENFEGQLLGIKAFPATADAAVNQNIRGNDVRKIAAACRSFGTDFRAQVASWQDRLGRLRASGQRVVAWGAGAKAVTFLNIVDPAGDAISHIVDVNPRKTGCFVPGSGQQIVEPRSLRELRPDVLLIMNAVYRHEIGAAVRALDLDPIVLVA
jgi:C-methyltransferase C-terminal domain/Methyltransferase domain